MISHQILELLVRQLWQVTILCVVAGWVSRTILVNRPVLSFQLWVVVLVKCVTPPIWASQCGVFSWFFQHTSSASVALCERLAGGAVSTDALTFLLIGIWLAGFLYSLLSVYVKWRRIQRRIRIASIVPEDALQDRLRRLAKHLGIKQTVELVLTNEPVGPAVLGMWKPILILPTLVTNDKDVDELEPILAHELLHIRRRDTLIALFETFVRALWWFHPVVQRAADQTTQAGELCCDGDAMEELMYPPRRYADSLLAVLEAKCRLQPLVATPGVRQEQITQERLRRIMIPQYSKPRTLLRVGLMVLALMVLLPGKSLPLDAPTANVTKPTVGLIAATFVQGERFPIALGLAGAIPASNVHTGMRFA